MNTDKIMMYTKDNCPQCTIAKGRLKLANISYTEVYIDKQMAARQTLLDAGHKSVPVFYVDGKHIKLEDILAKHVKQQVLLDNIKE